MARGKTGKQDRVVARKMAKGKAGAYFNGGDKMVGRGTRVTKKMVKRIALQNMSVSQEVEDTKIKARSGLLTGNENPNMVAIALCSNMMKRHTTGEFNDFKGHVDVRFRKAYEQLGMKVEMLPEK